MIPGLPPVGRPVVAAHEPSPDGYDTPPPGARLTVDQKHDLRLHSGCPLLPELADLLARACGPDWAIAGRIATRLHAARLDARTPSDEDPASTIEVVIRRDPRESLQRALHEAGHVGEVRYEQESASFDLLAGLTVHVMRSGENRWGSIDDVEWHGGVPMISLAALGARTRRDLDSATDAGDLVAAHAIEAALDRIENLAATPDAGAPERRGLLGALARLEELAIGRAEGIGTNSLLGADLDRVEAGVLRRA